MYKKYIKLTSCCRGNWHGEVAIKKLKMDPDLDNQSQLQAFKLEVRLAVTS